MKSLFECAEHALLEMRDRFDLKRGDSVSLDALEDEINKRRAERDHKRCAELGICICGAQS